MLEPTSLGGHSVPGIWRLMLAEDLWWIDPPDERQATCRSCYQAALGEYRNDCRCCTYFPEIPNFMLGLALDQPASRTHVERLIARGWALPLGLVPSPVQYRGAVEAQSKGLFGRLPQLLCPFVEPQTFDCRIYSNRNSICSTFFCVHDHGQSGATFWHKLQQLVGRVERTLAQWAMGQTGIDHANYVAQLDRSADRLDELCDPGGAWSAAARRMLWGEWLGRESEFFRGCAEQALARGTALYRTATNHRFVVPVAYDAAVRRTIADGHRGAAPEAAQPDDYQPIDALWYQVQLAARNLWRLPFGDTIALADDVELRQTDGAAEAVQGELTLSVDAAHLAVLRLLRRSHPLDEQFLQLEQLVRLGRPKRALAELMRLGLVVQTHEAAD